MSRYMVQRTFPEGLHIPVDNGGGELCRAVIERNAEEGVTWISSFVSEDKNHTFCIYERPRPRRSEGPQLAMSCRSIRSRGSACSIHTSTPR